MIPGPSSNIPLGTGVPAIPKKTFEKILTGEYINFAELPLAKGKSGPIPATLLEDQVVVMHIKISSSQIFPPGLSALQST